MDSSLAEVLTFFILCGILHAGNFQSYTSVVFNDQPQWQLIMVYRLVLALEDGVHSLVTGY